MSKRTFFIVFPILLAAIIANYYFQLSHHSVQEVKKSRRKRHSLVMDKEVVKRLLQARMKNPAFLQFMEKNYLHLEERKLMIYAEALGGYNSKEAFLLLKKIYQMGSKRVKTRLVKGLAQGYGKFNQQLLEEIFQHQELLDEQGKIYLYIALYQQNINNQRKAEIINFLKQFLTLTKPDKNFTILQFFYQQQINSADIRRFAKSVTEKVLQGDKEISTTLFTIAIRYLSRFEKDYLYRYHKRITLIFPPVFIEYYYSVIHYICPPKITDELLQRLKDPETPFNLFRIIASELKLFGGDLIFTQLTLLKEDASLGEQKGRFLTVLLKQFSRGKQRLCN